MEPVKKFLLGGESSNYLTAAIITFVAIFVGYVMWTQSDTMPVSNFQVQEGFGGVAVGSGLPDCLRTSSEAAQVADFFLQRETVVEEGKDDLRELLLLLSKLACFKKDLMSTAGLVESTRYQAYSTAHDIEPIAETTSRCLAKTIPPRDLELAFDKWASRGGKLLQRLCTAYGVSPSENEKVKKTFSELLADVKDVASNVCFVGEPLIAGKKFERGAQSYEPTTLADLGAYKGYY